MAPSTYDTHTMTVAPDLMQIIEDTIREGCIEVRTKEEEKEGKRRKKKKKKKREEPERLWHPM